MSWVSSIIVSILAAIAGALLAGVIASACVDWYHVTSREGAAGYFVVFTGLAGGVAGLFVGLVAARIIAAGYGPGFLKELGGALGAELAIAAIAALLCRVLADVPPTIDKQRLNLEVEFRFPVATNSTKPPTADGEWRFWLGSVAGRTQRASEEGKIRTNAVRFENERWIVPTEVLLFTERGKRTANLQKADTETTGFLVPLPARPGKTFEQWSDWLPRQYSDGQPWPADKISYRFRVQKEPPPPPPKTDAQVKAEEAALEEAEFAAVPADAPIERWFPYLYQDAQKQRAVSSIANRPNLAKELAQLALGKDGELAAKALWFIPKHPHPTAEFIALVQTAAADITERIRKVNVTTVEADPSYLGAADVSVRFSGWIDAVRTLRNCCGGDFTTELKTILELSRVRTDSNAMRMDVCRVASYYLHEWAGIEPLPTDPKPR